MGILSLAVTQGLGEMGADKLLERPLEGATEIGGLNVSRCVPNQNDLFSQVLLNSF